MGGADLRFRTKFLRTEFLWRPLWLPAIIIQFTFFLHLHSNVPSSFHWHLFTELFLAIFKAKLKFIWSTKKDVMKNWRKTINYNQENLFCKYCNKKTNKMLKRTEKKNRRIDHLSSLASFICKYQILVKYKWEREN